MHASVVNLEGLSGRALALPPSKPWLCSALPVKPDELPRRGRWCAPQPATQGPGFLGYLPSYLGTFTPPLTTPAPLTPAWSQAARRTLPTQQSEARHVFRHNDDNRRASERTPAST